MQTYLIFAEAFYIHTEIKDLDIVAVGEILIIKEMVNNEYTI